MNYVIVVAGGKGLRMGTDIPKQFLPIGGKPVLMRTLEAFYSLDENIRLILVLPEPQQAYWYSLCDEYCFNIPHQIAPGGETRFNSVRNGLSFVPDDNCGVVCIHDGVRPFVSPEVIRRCLDEAVLKKAVIPVTLPTESIRHIKDDVYSESVARMQYRLVQTPQAFDSVLLKEAYKIPYNECFTDDASVVEGFGQSVYMVPGNVENIKITTPFDLLIAEAILRKI